METQILKELKEKLANYIQDRDVFLFEQIRKYQNESFVLDVLEVIHQDKGCTTNLWEIIADICFEKLGSYDKMNSDKRVQATNILAIYRQLLKRNAIQLSINEETIPDDILIFDRNEYSRMESKLRNELHGIDLKLVRCRDENELHVAEKDAITLVSMIKKRIQQIQAAKVSIKCHKRIYRDAFSKKQMLKVSVVKYEKVDKEGICFEKTSVLFQQTIPFKQSDKKTVLAANEIITKVNEEFKLEQALF